MKDPNSNQTVLASTTEMAVHKPVQRWSAARTREVVLRLLLTSLAGDKPETLTGVVEGDETFILESFKGKRSDMPRSRAREAANRPNVVCPPNRSR